MRSYSAADMGVMVSALVEMRSSRTAAYDVGTKEKRALKAVELMLKSSLKKIRNESMSKTAKTGDGTNRLKLRRLRREEHRQG